MSDRQVPLKWRISSALFAYTGHSVERLDYVEDPKTEGCIAVRAFYGPKTPLHGVEYFLLYYGAPGTAGPYNGFEIEEVEFTQWPPTSAGKEIV